MSGLAKNSPDLLFTNKNGFPILSPTTPRVRPSRELLLCVPCSALACSLQGHGPKGFPSGESPGTQGWALVLRDAKHRKERFSAFVGGLPFDTYPDHVSSTPKVKACLTSLKASSSDSLHQAQTTRSQFRRCTQEFCCHFPPKRLNTHSLPDHQLTHRPACSQPTTQPCTAAKLAAPEKNCSSLIQQSPNL